MNSVSFFHPYYLWVFFALAVPVIIHLLFRKKVIRLDFSSIRFLENTAVQASRRRRLKRIFLLLVRMCILSTIVVLFGQPYDADEPFSVLNNPQASVYCWIDPTVSMEYRVGTKALWQLAYNLCESLDSILPGTARMHYWDDGRNRFVDRYSYSLPSETAVRYGASNLDRMLNSFKSFRVSSRHLPVLMLFSDFQKENSEKLEEFLQKDSLLYPVLCVLMGEKNPWNYSILSTVLSGEAGPEIRCKIRASGRDLQGGYISVLFGPMRAGHEKIEIAKDSVKEIQIGLGISEDEGYGTVRLDVEDPFPHDNLFYFTEIGRKKEKVLIVASQEESFPIIAALGTLGKGQKDAPTIKSAEQVSFDDFDSSDVVILNSVQEPSQPLQSLINTGTSSCKLILFSPFLKEGPSSWNGSVSSFLKNSGNMAIVNSERPLFPVLPDTISDIWKGFPRREDKSVAIYSYCRPIPGTVLCRMSNGDPFVSHIFDRYGKSWIVFSTPIGVTEANNICETGFYIPFIDRIIQYGLLLAHSETAGWNAGDLHRNPYYGSRRFARVFSSGQDLLGLWDNQPFVSLEVPGIYTIQPHGELSYPLAVNIDSSECNFSYFIPKIARDKMRYVKIIDRARFLEFMRFRKARTGLGWLWVLLGLLIMAEVLLWDWKKKEVLETTASY